MLDNTAMRLRLCASAKSGRRGCYLCIHQSGCAGRRHGTFPNWLGDRDGCPQESVSAGLRSWESVKQADGNGPSLTGSRAWKMPF